MPIDLFGFSVGRTKRNNVNSVVSPEAAQANVPSFVMPEVDDAYTVDAGVPSLFHPITPGVMI